MAMEMPGVCGTVQLEGQVGRQAAEEMSRRLLHCAARRANRQAGGEKMSGRLRHCTARRAAGRQ